MNNNMTTSIVKLSKIDLSYENDPILRDILGSTYPLGSPEEEAEKSAARILYGTEKRTYKLKKAPKS